MIIHTCDVCKRKIARDWNVPEASVMISGRSFEFCEEHSKPVFQLLKRQKLLVKQPRAEKALKS